ncbi:hypothetical protein M405DRAFT_549395 [Rhizopogon salebrosus TDB-379]|nr:hypothetical protein M405DRAFT_549395 [Rhizopogon salebrosus TDB-379]
MHVYHHRLLHNNVNACAMMAVLPLCFLRSRLDALSRSAVSYAYVHIRFFTYAITPYRFHTHSPLILRLNPSFILEKFKF